MSFCVFVCQAEDGIRDLVRSRGLGDVYKRQDEGRARMARDHGREAVDDIEEGRERRRRETPVGVLSLIHI